MTTYIALLRGINVGGARPVPMAALRDLFTGLGYDRVATYVQSGNAVFNAPGRARPDRLRVAIEAEVAKVFGFDVAVIIRSATDLAAVAAANPFLDRGTDRKTLHVTFLAGEPSTHCIERPPGGTDAFELSGREVYLHCPSGYGKTKLTNAFFEKALGVAATTRNWNTVTKLVEMTGA